ncbi:hypothetical protein F5X68DRAFT_28797 [Plectosphaerella plurivora]|uniref:Uncharacterized protein n=1 Tax=Plectosphaerella plurivora TaxID=936078 RepID=A0A9P8VM49_9PEZI|nr:hypothetical protein F5X68DRAFT_28797 [Plectosphaerella plurivora]
MAAYTAIPGEERPSQTLDHATSSLIREEVRALMREELQALRAAPVPAPQAAPAPAPPTATATQDHDGNPPPSYESASANSPRRAPEDMQSEAARLLGENEPPVDADPSTLPRRLNWFARGFRSLPGVLRGLIIFAPVVAVFVLMPIITINGDVLQVTVVGLLLAVANPFVFIVACLIGYAFGGMDDAPGDNTPQEKARTKEAGSIMFTSYWFLTWAAFSWIMYLMYEHGNKSMVQRYLLAGRFDAKITHHLALETVTECIETNFPNHNATIDDFTFCFKKMGMPQTIVP